MTGTRDDWQARRTDTGERVAPSYYNGASAIAAARRAARTLGVSIQVTRNGRDWGAPHQPPEASQS